MSEWLAIDNSLELDKGNKKNYKDPNHRLASLNGSAYSDSVYNEGDIFNR